MVERKQQPSRYCTNPDCRRITHDINETLCVVCGWVTAKATKPVVHTKGAEDEAGLGE